MTYVSIVIPAYNESVILSENLRTIIDYFSAKNREFEVIIINDGSIDDTADILKDIKEVYGNIRVIDNSSNMGKGYSVKKGVFAASGEYILLTDADLQIFIDEFEKLIGFIDEDHPVAVASRRLPGAILSGKQPLVRVLARSMLYHISNLLILNGITDPQCGFKLFKRDAAHALFEKITINGFGFDLEMFCIAERLGIKINQMPVKWSSSRTSSVNILCDGLKILYDIAIIKTKQVRKKFR